MNNFKLINLNCFSGRKKLWWKKRKEKAKAEALLEARADEEDAHFSVVPAMFHYLKNIEDENQYEKFQLYEDRKCAIGESLVIY